MQISTKVQAKALVSALRRELKAVASADAPSLSHTQCLELMARTFGYKTWNELEASLSDSSPDTTVSPMQEALTVPVWSPLKGAMSTQQYVASRGIRCPVCGLQDGLSGDSLDVDGGTCSQEVTCSNCNASWVAYYKLDNYEFLGMDCVQACEAELFEDASFPKVATAGFVRALHLWLLAGGAVLTEELQEKLDEAVTDAYLSLSLEELNRRSEKPLQDSSITAVERLASEVNNQGDCAQLAFLASLYPSQKDAVNALAQNLGLDAGLFRW